jgi:uncharacterized protein YjiS (DUF1127 family)
MKSGKESSMFASLHTASMATRRVQSRGLFDRLAGAVARAVTLHEQRRALALLDDARLRDLGLTRAQAEAESARPIWDMPAR